MEKKVREIAKNSLAMKVKLADLAHNSELTRLDHEPTERDLEISEVSESKSGTAWIMKPR